MTEADLENGGLLSHRTVGERGRRGKNALSLVRAEMREAYEQDSDIAR